MNNIFGYWNLSSEASRKLYNYKSQWYTECEQIDKNDMISSHVKIYLHM